MPPKATATCPICHQPATVAHAPFCSARCRDRDLLNWLGGVYAIPGPPEEDDMPERNDAPE